MEMINFHGQKRPATYLGDGVYAIFDGFGIWLHTGSHDRPDNRVYLEPPVLTALINFEKQSKTKEVIEQCRLLNEP